MPALLVFVIVAMVVGVALIAVSSLVGSRRRAQGRRLDDHVRDFGRR